MINYIIHGIVTVVNMLRETCLILGGWAMFYIQTMFFLSVAKSLFKKIS